MILPWRRGARPEGLTVSREGETIIVKSSGVTIRVDPNGYTYTDRAGTVSRRHGK